MGLPPVISLPARLDLAGAIAFGNTLSGYQNHETVVLFDCGELEFVEPFGMLYTAQMIQQFKRRIDCQVAPINHMNASATDYAAHMGFFQACGFMLGKTPGQAKGSENYLPITYQSVADLRASQRYAADVFGVGETIARRLTQKSSGTLFTAVAYAIREVVRNVVEHSEANEFGYCAQHWPQREEVEISIIDSGMGLWMSLSQNPHLSIHSHKRALELAIYPGISSKAYANAPKTTGVQNAGFGLYMLYRLCSLGGNFFLGSGNAGLEHSSTEKEHRHYNLTLNGTVLSLSIRGKLLKNFDNQWDTFLAEGESEAKKIIAGRAVERDKMSFMLHAGFTPLKRNFVVGNQVQDDRYGIGIVTEVIESPNGQLLRVRFGTRLEKVAAHKVQLIDSSDVEGKND